MKHLIKVLVIIAAIFPQSLYSQSFTGATGAIPDNGPVVSFPIIVSGVNPAVIDTGFGLESVCISLTHNYLEDIKVRLQAPDGMIIDLSLGNGGSGNNYTGTCFNDNASANITSGNPPYNGQWKPQQPLYPVNNGQNPNGTWNLLIQDIQAGYSGTLTSSTITFGNNPGIPFPFTSSNLPIIKINTLNQVIVDDPKIHCKMQVIDNGAGIRNYFTDTVYTYDGWIGIEIRGSSSQMFPKKSFGVETRDSMQNDTSIALLGMPAENDWVFNANYTDKTFLRNTLAYDLFNKMGRYSSRTRYAEVFINNAYQGIYIICEKIKRDSNRVDIAKLLDTDNTWPEISGGYILKVDKTTGGGGQGFPSLYPPTSGGPTPIILYDYPDPTALTWQQTSYIVAYMDSFENALHGPNFTDTIVGYRKYADMNSFIDFMILNEISKCVDSYRISAFLYKNKITDGGKLVAGPVWDFDIAFGNADYYNGQFTTGWSYNLNQPSAPNQPPFWWPRLMQDLNFKNALKCRWNDLRTNVLSTPVIMNWIDSMALMLNESQQRNFTAWPIIGTYVWPNPSPIATSYAGEIAQLKNWVTNRLGYLDVSWPGTCTISGLDQKSSAFYLDVFPNPASQNLWIKSGDVMKEIIVSDISGRKIMASEALNQTDFNLDVSVLVSGVYLVNVKTEKGNLLSKKIVIE